MMMRSCFLKNKGLLDQVSINVPMLKVVSYLIGCVAGCLEYESIILRHVDTGFFAGTP
jgi:hypothetical protein